MFVSHCYHVGMSSPRRHHYISQSYLTAWTTTGKADGQLQVIDKSTGRFWQTKPINAAFETDLYKIDPSEATEDIPEMVIENFFAGIESDAIPIIRQIIEVDTPLSATELEKVVVFLALLIMRVPKQLNLIDEVLRKPVEWMYQKLEAEGKFPQSKDPTLDALMKGWFDKGTIQIKIKPNARLGMMVDSLPNLAKLLARRHWTILRANPGVGDLICTDSPVLLEWIKPVPDGSSPGFGLENTAVFVPLSPAVSLFGLWNLEPTVRTLSEKKVEYWNSNLLHNAHRFVFSRGDFSSLHESGSIEHRSDILLRWKSP